MNQSHPTPHSNLTLLLTTILLVSSIGQVTSDLYLPSLPAIANHLHISTHAIQFTIALYMTGFCLSQLLYGPLSDVMGRRRPLLIGLTINVMGGLLCWLAPNINVLFLGRLLQGLGTGAGTALSRSILRDLFNKATLAKYNSYLAMSTVIILTLAPIIGGHIQFYAGWRVNFALLSGYGFIILLLFYYRIPETFPSSRRLFHFSLRIVLSHCKQLATHRQFLRFALCPLFTYAGILAWLTAAPIVLQNVIGLNPVQFGWLYLFSGVGFASGGFVNAKLVTKHGIEKMVMIGMVCQLIAGLLMALGFFIGYLNTTVIIAPIILFMFGSSLVFPNSSAGALTPFPNIAGTAAALFGFMQILGGALSSTSIALLPDHNQLPIAYTFILTALLSLLIFYWFRGSSND